MRKKRGYKRDIPQKLLRDYKVFVIACEGAKTEPRYFELFNNISKRLKVDIIEDLKPENSAPKWVLNRAKKYIDEQGLAKIDQLWLVMDTDKWTDEQLRNVSHYCDEYSNWNIVISNPCFEVWLYLHENANIASSTAKTCKEFKKEVNTLVQINHPLFFISGFKDAIKNARQQDSDPIHFNPKFKETKVYQLGQAILELIGQRKFDDYIENQLPKLIEEYRRNKNTKRSRK